MAHKPKSSPRLTSKNRKVGRWFLGETLTKNACYKIKKGYDRKDGRVVALKFIPKSNLNQGLNEIEALRTIKDEHVTQLLAYNVNAKYPEKDGSITPTTLLVLEYLPGRSLFDIVYYTSALKESIARTYFHQLMHAMEAIHESGICHRDINPHNLWLDANFQLKVADLGVAKIFEPDQDVIMNTFSVGSIQYRAPEIWEEKEYTIACDIFSCGVVLFILIAGYPPFETATTKCRWYAPLIHLNARQFWKQHKGCGIPGVAKDLITRMLWYDGTKRISVRGIKRHKWYKGETLSTRALEGELIKLHRLMEIKMKEEEEKRKQELMKKEKERKVMLVVDGYIKYMQLVLAIWIPTDISHFILSIVRDIQFEYLMEDVYVCTIGDEINVKDSSGIWRKAQIQRYKSYHDALPLTVKLPKKIKDENIGDYWDNVEGVEVCYFIEKHMERDWIFIENKNIICDCKVKCKNEIHEITTPDYNTYFD